MRIRLTKISDARHRMGYRRDDGSGEEVELESKSFLVHDLIHFAVETEAQLRGSFWGQLAAGRDLASFGIGMKERTMEEVQEAVGTEPAITETVVGIFTGVALGRSRPEDALDALRRTFEANAVAHPAWLDLDFARRVEERLRRLTGEWRAVRYGGSMDLTFP